MRIVSVCRDYGNGGGMENVVHDRAEALRALGHDVTVVSAADGCYSDEFAEQCVTACGALKPDVVCLDSFDSGRPWWVGRPERVALTMHSNPWSLFFTKWNLWMAGFTTEPGASYSAMRRVCETIREADVVIAISGYEQGMLQDQCGVPEARLVYNPIAPYFFDAPITGPPADGYFLHVGHNAARGCAVALRAAEQAGVEVRFAAGLRRDEMVAVYDGCRALVLPTYRADGYDLTVAEAEARCRPALVGATGAYRSEAGGGIVALPLGDVDAWAEALSGPLPEVDGYDASRHEPGYHAAAWLEAVA